VKPPANPSSGVLLVDKPQGITSHDVVSRARKTIGTRKVGHAGTLDPMATGLLVLGVNSSTRLLSWVVGLEKEYTATIRLGAGSSTDDAEGELGATADARTLADLTDAAIAAGVRQLTGAIRQRPSSVSAIKVDGRRAYALAREGAEIVLEERPVTISVFEIVETRRVSTGSTTEWVDVDVRVECSTGTYIRALARDLGGMLGVGGHLTALRRTRIGPFAIDRASTLDDDLATHLLDPAAVAGQLFPTIALDAQEADDLAHGKRIPIALEADGPIAAVAPDGRLVGLVESVAGRAHVLVNFPTGAGA